MITFQIQILEVIKTTLSDKYKVLITTPQKRKKSLSTRRRKKSKKDGFVFTFAGAHGVGKTTLYHKFQKNFQDYSNIKFFPERLRAKPPVPFGSKNKQTAFRSELHYNQQMIKRNELIKKFVRHHREHIAIADRSPLSTIVYARALNLPDIDYNLISDTFNSVSWQEEHIIYFEADPNTIMRRIYKRGSLDLERKKWNEDDLDYLKKIINYYEQIFKEYRVYSKNRLHRIWTEKKTPTQIFNEIYHVIETITGLQLKKKIAIPANQSDLFSYT